ncbi:GNAT family N-acetyltransferase [Shouchella lehensis]|uniref:N-acetyltransferase n=1 Tax=Shouchella lehensis G1 TaxID=1246626 RepID=A0A060LZ08_9BACI|nr:GNAT family protein [Shouchella lehensis]AIC93034.1 N-acetyltransferase [Shouchella lehensis G1]
MFEHKLTEQLSLKLIDFQDADAIFTLTDENRMYLKEWLPWLDHIKEVNDTATFIRRCLQSHADNNGLHTVIVYDGHVVGMASFNSLNWANKTASIGYWVSEKVQGRGIVTAVAHDLTNYAFQQLNMNKVEIRAAAENQKSQRVPMKLGFTREGTIRQAEWLYDHYVDHVVFGMLASEWKDRVN